LPHPFRTVSSLLPLLLVACSHPLAGGEWTQVDVEHGMELQFAKDGQLVVHGPGTEESHDHLKGTWTRSDGNLTLQGKWERTGMEERWTGTLADGVITLVSDAGVSLRFHRH
jgi:hypothetical protein